DESRKESCSPQPKQGIAQQMLDATTPEEHRDLGRKVKNFDYKTWDEREPTLPRSLLTTRCKDIDK
ncbi:hypothetical protein LTR16_012674, partial [Cryomyces antarcticus]